MLRCYSPSRSGLSRQQFYALMSNIDEHLRLSISKLCKKTMMTKAQMTGMLDLLSDMGMIERVLDTL